MTAAAFAAGQIRSRHAEVITRTLDEITPALDGEQAVAELEATMVDAARVVDPLRLASRCRRLRDAAAPQLAVAEDWNAFLARDLSLSRTIGGMIAIGGMLDPLTGETVLAGLQALAARPAPPTTALPGSGAPTRSASWPAGCSPSTPPCRPWAGNAPRCWSPSTCPPCNAGPTKPPRPPCRPHHPPTE